MAEQKEPKKETVRIAVPGPAQPAPAGNTSGRDTVRINLPARPPGASPSVPLRPPGSEPAAATPAQRPVRPPPFIPPPAGSSAPAVPGTSASFSPKPPGVRQAAAAAIQPIDPVTPPPAPSSAPKKETARITILPDPPARPTASVQMKKTQPLINMPDANIRGPQINVAPNVARPEKTELVPTALCWAVLGASALILLIQIWNYFV